MVWNCYVCFVVDGDCVFFGGELFDGYVGGFDGDDGDRLVVVVEGVIFGDGVCFVGWEVFVDWDECWVVDYDVVFVVMGDGFVVGVWVCLEDCSFVV